MNYALFLILSVSTLLMVYASLHDEINNSIQTYGNTMLDEMKTFKELNNCGTMYSPKKLRFLLCRRF